MRDVGPLVVIVVVVVAWGKATLMGVDDWGKGTGGDLLREVDLVGAAGGGVVLTTPEPVNQNNKRKSVEKVQGIK